MQTDPHTAELLQLLLDTPGTSARQRVQQDMVRCQRDARLKRLAKGGMSMLLTHAMLGRIAATRRKTLQINWSPSALMRLSSASLCWCLERVSIAPPLATEVELWTVALATVC